MKHYAIVFNRKTGKTIKVLSQEYGDAFLKMWTLNNLTSSRDCIIFDDEGFVSAYFEGKKNDIPTFCNDMVGKHVEEFGFTLEEIM